MIRRALPDEWEALRAIRLRALADAPDAFATTHAEALARGEADWRGWATRAHVLVAEEAGAWVALAASWEPAPGEREIVSMWVAPEARGRGIGRALVEAQVAHARMSGARRVVLWVYEGNGAARSLYASAGFVATRREPHPRLPGAFEWRMERTAGEV